MGTAGITMEGSRQEVRSTLVSLLGCAYPLSPTPRGNLHLSDDAAHGDAWVNAILKELSAEAFGLEIITVQDVVHMSEVSRKDAAWMSITAGAEEGIFNMRYGHDTSSWTTGGCSMFIDRNGDLVVVGPRDPKLPRPCEKAFQSAADGKTGGWEALADAWHQGTRSSKVNRAGQWAIVTGGLRLIAPHLACNNTKEFGMQAAQLWQFITQNQAKAVQGFGTTKSDLRKLKYILAHLQQQWKGIGGSEVAPLHTDRGVNIEVAVRVVQRKHVHLMGRKMLRAWRQLDEEEAEEALLLASETTETTEPDTIEVPGNTSVKQAADEHSEVVTAQTAVDQKCTTATEEQDASATYDRAAFLNRVHQFTLAFRAVVAGLQPSLRTLVKITCGTPLMRAVITWQGQAMATWHDKSAEKWWNLMACDTTEGSVACISASVLANLPAADEERSEVAAAVEWGEDVDAQSKPEDTGDKNFDHSTVVQGAHGDRAGEDPEIQLKEKRSITSTHIPEGSGESAKTEKRRKHTAHKGKGRVWRVECHTHAMEHLDPTEVGVAVEVVYPELTDPERILYDTNHWNIGPDDVRGDTVWGFDNVTLTFRSFAPATQAHGIWITTSSCSQHTYLDMPHTREFRISSSSFTDSDPIIWVLIAPETNDIPNYHNGEVVWVLNSDRPAVADDDEWVRKLKVTGEVDEDDVDTASTHCMTVETTAALLEGSDSRALRGKDTPSPIRRHEGVEPISNLSEAKGSVIADVHTSNIMMQHTPPSVGICNHCEPGKVALIHEKDARERKIVSQTCTGRVFMPPLETPVATTMMATPAGGGETPAANGGKDQRSDGGTATQVMRAQAGTGNRFPRKLGTYYKERTTGESAIINSKWYITCHSVTPDAIDPGYLATGVPLEVYLEVNMPCIRHNEHILGCGQTYCFDASDMCPPGFGEIEQILFMLQASTNATIADVRCEHCTEHPTGVADWMHVVKDESTYADPNRRPVIHIYLRHNPTEGTASQAQQEGEAPLCDIGRDEACRGEATVKYPAKPALPASLLAWIPDSLIKLLPSDGRHLPQAVRTRGGAGDQKEDSAKPTPELITDYYLCSVPKQSWLKYAQDGPFPELSRQKSTVGSYIAVVDMLPNIWGPFNHNKEAQALEYNCWFVSKVVRPTYWEEHLVAMCHCNNPTVAALQPRPWQHRHKHRPLSRHQHLKPSQALLEHLSTLRIWVPPRRHSQV